MLDSWDHEWCEKGVDFHFRRIWLDRTVDLIGIMLWNDINRKAYADNGGNDKKSGKVADLAQEKFLRTFA